MPHKRNYLPYTILVVGLPYTMTEPEWSAYMSKHAAFRRCWLDVANPRNRGYGWVSCYSPSHELSTLSFLRGHILEGRRLWAYPSGSDADDHPYTIFVKGFAWDMTADGWNDFLVRYGDFKKSWVDLRNQKNRGYGWVSCWSEKQAEGVLERLDGRRVGKRTLRAEWGRRKSGGRREHERDGQREGMDYSDANRRSGCSRADRSTDKHSSHENEELSGRKQNSNPSRSEERYQGSSHRRESRPSYSSSRRRTPARDESRSRSINASHRREQEPRPLIEGVYVACTFDDIFGGIPPSERHRFEHLRTRSRSPAREFRSSYREPYSGSYSMTLLENRYAAENEAPHPSPQPKDHNCAAQVDGNRSSELTSQSQEIINEGKAQQQHPHCENPAAPLEYHPEFHDSNLSKTNDDKEQHHISPTKLQALNSSQQPAPKAGPTTEIESQILREIEADRRRQEQGREEQKDGKHRPEFVGMWNEEEELMVMDIVDCEMLTEQKEAWEGTV